MKAAGVPFGEIREFVATVGDQGWAAASFAIALESGLAVNLDQARTAEQLAERSGLPPALVERALDVLVAAGLVEKANGRFASEDLAAFARSQAADAARSELMSGLLQAAEHLRAARRGDFELGWRYTDPEILRAQGVMSAGAVEMLEKRLLPSLPGMIERLSTEGAAFLDVGAGVGSVTIEMCRRFPRLRAVGLEPQEAPFSIASGAVAEAGLEDRIALRRQLVQDLEDEDAFDFVWLPATFLPTGVLERGLMAVARAMRGGAWMVTGVLGTEGDGLRSAAGRLRAVLWGSDALSLDQLESFLGVAGFGEVGFMPTTPAGLMPVVAQRP